MRLGLFPVLLLSGFLVSWLVLPVDATTSRAAGKQVALAFFAGVSKKTGLLLFVVLLVRGSGGVEVMSASCELPATGRSLMGVSNNRGRIGDEGPMVSTAPETAG